MSPHCLTVWTALPGWAVSSPPVIPTPPETRAVMTVNSNIKTYTYCDGSKIQNMIHPLAWDAGVSYRSLHPRGSNFTWWSWHAHHPRVTLSTWDSRVSRHTWISWMSFVSFYTWISLKSRKKLFRHSNTNLQHRDADHKCPHLHPSGNSNMWLFQCIVWSEVYNNPTHVQLVALV